MRARRLLEGSTFTAETLSVVFQAYDAAWREVEHLFAADPEDARARLAHAVLIVAREDTRDVERLKDEALQVFALAIGSAFGQGDR